MPLMFSRLETKTTLFFRKLEGVKAKPLKLFVFSRVKPFGRIDGQSLAACKELSVRPK